MRGQLCIQTPDPPASMPHVPDAGAASQKQILKRAAPQLPLPRALALVVADPAHLTAAPHVPGELPVKLSVPVQVQHAGALGLVGKVGKQAPSH